MPDDLSLSALFRRALTSLSSLSTLPTLSAAFAELFASALADLTTVQARVSALALFSSNEALDDVPTGALAYMAAGWARGEAENRAPARARAERLAHMQAAEKAYRAYVEQAEQYGLVSAEDKALHTARQIADPTRRREAKIKMHRAEKDVRARIETVRRRTGARTAALPDGADDFALLAALLPAGAADEELDSDVEDALREATILLLKLGYAQSQAALGHLSEELALLRSFPPEPTQEERDRDRGRTADDGADWRLDAPRGGLLNRGGPLLDPRGRPLQPFTILPQGERGALMKAVFGPDHALPSMTIDEYLEVERARGGIIEGGGPGSEAEPTSKEQLALDAEMDGSRFGMEREEEKRVKDEEWARYTDENKRGAGNTMNRG